MLNVRTVCSVGPAADAQNTENLTEQLASELEANSHTAVRSLWKRTCFQVILCELIASEQTIPAAQNASAVLSTLQS